MSYLKINILLPANTFLLLRSYNLIIVAFYFTGKVKQMAEIKIGVLTQCIRGRTLSRLTPATTCNILLKINSKLNGVNHTMMDCNQRYEAIIYG